LARDRVEREAVTRDRLASGELGLDIYGLRNTLEDLGVTYFESADDLS
jgi:4-hydroxy-4-methyl-2-oxoglutarate aldolase